MKYFSKTQYCDFWQCPKMLWLRQNCPGKMSVDENARFRMDTGKNVGAYARNIFGEYVDVTVCERACLDINKMLEKTRTEIEKGTPIICEASFEYSGMYCAVDILRKEDEGWSIYEVKSSTDPNKSVYMADIAYQKYVLQKCGINIKSTNIIFINNEYILEDELNINELFNIKNVDDEIKQEEILLQKNILFARQISSALKEPDIDISERCQNPYKCGFWEYCTSHIPSPSVFNLYRMKFKKKIDFYKKGIVSFNDLSDNPDIKNEKQKRQIKYHLEDKGTYISKRGIENFLDELSFPLYFLDFETVQYAIPKYTGTKPYQQIPFQYSLHYLDKWDGELMHKEFLAEIGTDPRKTLAERLCNDIPEDVCIIAYNKSFECDVIKNLASIYSELASQLLNIESNIKDLLLPFQKGYYYNSLMGGSFSIKSVLPAIFPNDKSLDYKNLEGVQNGSEAMYIFHTLEYMNEGEQQIARKNLLKYCELDTYAMVKIWQELRRVRQC